MATLDFTVGPADTAAALGSGDLPVLATQRLLAWLEAATLVAAADLVGAGDTTVGSGANIGFNKVSAVAIGTNAGVSNDSSFAIGTASATSSRTVFG